MWQVRFHSILFYSCLLGQENSPPGEDHSRGLRKLRPPSQLVPFRARGLCIVQVAQALHVLAGEESAPKGMDAVTVAQRVRGEKGPVRMFKGQGEGGRPASRELGTQVQDEPKSQVQSRNWPPASDTPAGSPRPWPPGDLQVPDWPCCFSLLIEAGARTEAAGEPHGPGETARELELEGAGEQGRPRRAQPTRCEIPRRLFCAPPLPHGRALPVPKK